MITSKDIGAGHFLLYFLVAGAKTMWYEYIKSLPSTPPRNQTEEIRK
jgi:hypothetical protein